MDRHLPTPLLVAVLALGCGGNGGELGDERTVPRGSRGDRSIVAQECTGARAQTVDVNNDGQGDIRHVFDGAVRTCSQYDMNYDGRVDVVRFYLPDGETPDHEQHDFDFDGRIDQLSYYEQGRLVRKELDTNFDNVIDTWMWCAGGRVVRAERDRRNRGQTDTWEQYEAGVLTRVSYDNNNDGEPEKWEVFVGGRLTEIAYDSDGDGEPDRREEVAIEGLGATNDDVLYCEFVSDAEREADRRQVQARRQQADQSRRPAAPTEGTAPVDDADDEDDDSDAPSGGGEGMGEGEPFGAPDGTVPRGGDG